MQNVKSEHVGASWKGYLRHKLGSQAMIHEIAPGDNNSNINIWLRKIDWPWFKIYKSRHRDLEGVRLPKRFGRAYTEYDMDVDVFYIIPINLIVAGWRALSLRIKWRWPEKFAKYERQVVEIITARVERYDHNAFEQGRKTGYEDGYVKGFKLGQDEEWKRINAHFNTEVKKDG